jgi:hypothetical protein
MQQVPSESRLAGAERSVQFDERIGQARVAGQRAGRGGTSSLVGPMLRAGF